MNWGLTLNMVRWGGVLLALARHRLGAGARGRRARSGGTTRLAAPWAVVVSVVVVMLLSAPVVDHRARAREAAELAELVAHDSCPRRDDVRR
jgi:hypothetical protein